MTSGFFGARTYFQAENEHLIVLERSKSILQG
jgi:hypothetical protein